MVIYLNGPINAGKSTVSKLLVERLSRAVRIEIDDLPVPSAMSLEESIRPLLDDAAALAICWHQRGFIPIVVWPISPNDHVQFVASMGTASIDVFTFTLAPSLENALTNRGGRELTDWERKRISYHYACDLHRPPFRTILDNTNESPERTADRIVKELEARGAGILVSKPGQSKS
jgi:hypothetical protein